MELSLAIALTCEPAGCRVRYLAGGETSTVRYATPVQDRIKIRPGDLVVVDTAAEPAQLVWRWWSGRVERVEGGSLVVSRRVTQRHPGDPERGEQRLPLPGWLEAPVAAGDTVFLLHDDSGEGILDAGSDGVPAHPKRIQAERFPEIVAAYARMANDS